MKFIVIGLGYFGSTLAINLTRQGHEVIGIDNHYEKIEEFKDSITHVMEMDTTNEKAMESLPLEDSDAVIVAIGEDVGSSILTLSILKNLKVNRIIGRIISTVHSNILKQIGIDEVIHPEEESAYTIISRLHLKNALKIYEIEPGHVIAELYVPEKYNEHTLDTINLAKRFNLHLVGIKKFIGDKEPGKKSRNKYKMVYDLESTNTVFTKDILLVAGELSDLKKFADG